MKPAEQAQVDFIKDLLRNGTKYGDILAQFGTKWHKVSKRTFDRRYKLAEADVQGEQRRIQDLAEGNVARKVEALESKILSVIERKEILTRIALGQIPLKKAMVCDGVIEFVDVVPDWMDRKNAIAELNKMAGDYAPTRTDLTINKAGLDAVKEVYEK